MTRGNRQINPAHHELESMCSFLAAMFRLLWTILILAVLATASAEQQRLAIDAQRSTITVHARTAGLFSAFGHDHEVQAPIARGSVTLGSAPAVELTIASRELQVIDKDVSAKDRAEIQRRMHAEVLDSAHFPEIVFRSRNIEETAAGQWMVRGDLTLRGQMRPIALNVGERGGGYVGRAMMKQKDFGITPVSLAGGTVKVRNELNVEFEIFLQRTQ